MKMLLSILSITGFIVSFVGYLALAKRILKIDFCFIPTFVISSISIIVYFGGIFNILYPVSCGVYVIGILFFIYFFTRRKKDNLHSNNKFHLLDYCFFIGCIPFLLLLLKEHLLHYDNFSHWATVVKVMIANNAFPSAKDNLVGFSNYPLGTSSLLYYAALFLGHSENILILTQGLLIFALFYSLFGLIKKPQCFLLSAILGAGLSTLSFFNLTIRINNLLVDFILPLIALVCFVIINRFKDDLGKMLILLLPLQALLVIVKSTGIIYLFIIVCTFLIETSKTLNLREKGLALLTLLLSLSSYIAWQIHVKLIFSGVENKFSLSTTAIKTTSDVQTIITNYLKACVDISSRPFLGFIICNILVIAIYFFIQWRYQKRWYKLKRDLLALDIMVILYYAGILALYVFSMPQDEAIELAGFERYASSIIVLFVGALVLSLVSIIQESILYDETGHMLFTVPQDKHNYQKTILISLSVMILILTSEYNGMASIDSNYNSSLPHTISSIVGDNWNQEDDIKYLMYGSDSDGQMTNYFFQYVSRYYLYDSLIDAVCTLYEPNLINLLSQYDRFVIVESDSYEKFLLNKYFKIDGEVGIYDIVKNGDNLSLNKIS